MARRGHTGPPSSRRAEPARGRTVSGGHGGGDTPVPIPNTAVKPASADGTWGVTPWESRTPPGFLFRSPPHCGGLLRVRDRVGRPRGNPSGGHASSCPQGRSGRGPGGQAATALAVFASSTSFSLSAPVAVSMRANFSKLTQTACTQVSKECVIKPSLLNRRGLRLVCVGNLLISLSDF